MLDVSTENSVEPDQTAPLIRFHTVCNKDKINILLKWKITTETSVANYFSWAFG